jgi:hypothetical protein
MSRGHRKYLREEESKDDKHQARFSKDSSVALVPRTKIKIFATLNVNMKVMCPFCLKQDKLQLFLISTKKGISQKMAKCPECRNGMRMESLTADMTPEQFAEWVFEYSGSGYWQKVKFHTFKDRLYKIGWARRFWDKYKELKGESGIESYEDHMEQQQREWAVEQGYVEG